MKKDKQTLPPDTVIEVISIRRSDGKVFKKNMRICEFEVMKKKDNFNYLSYQLGFSQYKITD